MIQVYSGALLAITPPGNLTINTTANEAIWNLGTVENNGIITIGNLSGLSSYGIYNESVTVLIGGLAGRNVSWVPPLFTLTASAFVQPALRAIA